MAIYSGADLFLMPSKSEPCGLSQMIAMRYGTVPIVRETGGLKDTVRPYEAWRDAGNGFTFANYASSDMLYVIREAVSLYKDNPEAFARLRQRAMAGDFSWAKSAKEYLRIYASITGQAWPVVAESEDARPFEVASSAESAPAADEPKKVRKSAAKKTAVKKTEESAGETPVKRTRKTTKKTAETAEEEAAEKPAKRTRKTVAKKAEEITEETAEKPVKKAAAKKTNGKKETTKKETTKIGTAQSTKKVAAE